MIIWELPDSVKEVLRDAFRKKDHFSTKPYSTITDFSYSTKEGTRPYYEENGDKYVVDEIPPYWCERLGCYSCMYSKFEGTYKGCYCFEVCVMEDGTCLSYEPKEVTIEKCKSQKSAATRGRAKKAVIDKGSHRQTIKTACKP
jgi:hypothetical protein